MIDPLVKGQARGQNNWSRALKWGIVHLCSLITYIDWASFIEVWVFWISYSCKKCGNYYAKLQKMRKFNKITYFVFNHISETV